MPTVTVDEAFKEQLSRQDVTRPRKVKAQKEPSIRLERKPKASVQIAYLDPRLIYHEASDTPNREAIIETAETLNPTPNKDMNPRTEILKTG
jgi:hypothetical protein